MKKKVKQVRRRAATQGPNAKAKVTEAQLPSEQTTPGPVPASPKYAGASRFDPATYKQLREERQKGGFMKPGGESPPPPVRSRHAGPGLDLLGLPPAGTSGEWNGTSEASRLIPTPAGGSAVSIVNGVCEGCVEKITQPRDHCWWCPWWDTEEGKKVSPF